MELIRGFISCVVYGIFAKFSLKAIFSLLRANFFSALIYSLIAIGVVAWTGNQIQLWSVDKVISTIRNLDFGGFNIIRNNNIRFNIRNFPQQF